MGPGTCSVEGVVAGFSRADMKWGGLQTRPIFFARRRECPADVTFRGAVWRDVTENPSSLFGRFSRKVSPSSSSFCARVR